MSLGSYSIIRYSNNLNDQRVNLGIVVWHPVDGLRYRFTTALDRAQAVDPTVLIRPLRSRLEAIATELDAKPTKPETIENLSRQFTEGLEVAPPYPAQIHSVEETLEHLYQMLVSPVPEIRRASSQQQFEGSFKKTILNIAKKLKIKCEDRGQRKIGALVVKVGIQTVVDHERALWRALSLQSHEHTDKQLAFAKATALDIRIVRGIHDFKKHLHYVALQSPKPTASERLEDSVAWLKNEADEVFVVPNAQTLSHTLEKELSG